MTVLAIRELLAKGGLSPSPQELDLLARVLDQLAPSIAAVNAASVSRRDLRPIFVVSAAQAEELPWRP